MFLYKEMYPMAELCPPEVFSFKEPDPTAELFPPVVFLFNEKLRQIIN